LPCHSIRFFYSTEVHAPVKRAALNGQTKARIPNLGRFGYSGERKRTTFRSSAVLQLSGQ